MAEIDVTASEVGSFEGDELLTLCRQVALEMNRLAGLQAVIANQIWLESEGSSSQDTLTKRHGCRSSVELIQRLTGESARVVSARVKLGRQTAVRSSFLGEELAPTQEFVAAGLESGYLNVESANLISRVIMKNTNAANTENVEVAERCLVQAATGLDFGAGDAPSMPLHTDDVRRLCLKWDEALDPDGSAPDDVDRLSKRFLNVGPTRDGMARVSGLLTAEVAAAFSAILSSLNNPRVSQDGSMAVDGRVGAVVADFSDVLDEVSDRGELVGDLISCSTGEHVGDLTSHSTDAVTTGHSIDTATTADTATISNSTGALTDGSVDAPSVVSGACEMRDPTDKRNPGQKRHDALATALNVALASRDLPVLQGASATIVVEVKEENFLRRGKGAGPAWLVSSEGTPAPIPMSAAHGLSCGAAIQAVVTDSLGRITNLGTPARIFSPTQRRAIALRDGGCVIPGCTVPAAWCEVHHVRPHALDGPTHTDNGVLLCRFHHSTIYTSGWEVTMSDGIPIVKPPDWLMNLFPGDSRQGWVNQVLADQTRRIRDKLEHRKHQKRWEPQRTGESLAA